VIKHKVGPKQKEGVGKRARRKRHMDDVLSSRGALVASELPHAGCTEVFVGIGGVPGAGKSHVMRELMRCTDCDFQSTELRPLIPAMLCRNLTIIGKSYELDTPFPGTDGLSNACPPQFRDCVSEFRK